MKFSIIQPLLVLAVVPTMSVAVGGETKLDWVNVGFRGTFKVGRWTPLEVGVTTESPQRIRVVVEAHDSDGNRAQFPAPTVDLQVGPNILRARFLSGRLDSKVRVRLVGDDGSEIAAVDASDAAKSDNRVRVLEQSQFVVLTIGNFAKVNGLASDATGEMSLGEEFTVVSLESHDLPNQSEDLAGADVVVIAGHYAIDAQRIAALKEWVHLGGHVLLSVGDAVEDYIGSSLFEWVSGPLKPEQQPAADWQHPIPIVRREPIQLRSLDGLENFAGQSSQIAFRGTVSLIQTAPSVGEAIALQFGDPLVYRAPYGFGRITFFAVSIDKPPIATWNRLPRVLRQLIIGEANPESENAAGGSSRLTQSGISDLSTQMKASRETFEEVERLTTWTVISLMLFYAVVVGPLDYLLVAKLLKRPQLTWITAPLLIAAATVATVYIARTTNGDRIQVNVFDIVDYDVTSRRCRIQSTASIYSPVASRYDIELTSRIAGRDGVQSAAMNVNIHGVPERNFGGMYRPSGIQFGESIYRYGAQKIENLAVPLWSTASVLARGNVEVDLPIQSNLKQVGRDRLSGTITHQFPQPITRWIIAYKGQVYYPIQLNKQIRSFQPWSPSDDGITSRHLEDFLTATRTVDNNAKKESEMKLRNVKGKYSLLNSDVLSIIRMISFHAAAGGRSYTSLDSNDFRDLDLSELAKLDRAVLFGQMALEPTEIRLNNEVISPTRREVIVRIVLPVEPAD
ncbi:MAG: hypothetical protein O3A00_15385 [Planctomycetota bacterium]|nr:hypothetical protein [Planctomycetota bacterium]